VDSSLVTTLRTEYSGVPRSPSVPAELTNGPFRTSDAIRAGLTHEQLRGAAWQRLHRDVFVHAGLPLTNQVRLEAARLAVPPGTVAVALTAAWLHGVLEPNPNRPAPVHVAAVRGRPQPRARAVTGSRLTLDPDDVVQIGDWCVTSPERTCFDLARIGPTVEAVVGVDAFLSAGLTTKERLWRYGNERRSWAGCDRLREAVLLGSDRVRSPAESRLRMLLVLAGLPEPLVNAPVHDEHGRMLGIPDLLYLRPLLGIEYDGSYHRDGDVHQADLLRENGMVTNGLPLLRYSNLDLTRRPRAVVQEVGAALHRPVNP
jgi:hypothetical protein